jgi:hypothetical protein
MEVYVRGTRLSTQDWLRAQQIPANELPSLNEEQKVEARRTNRSDEEFARRDYAGSLSQQRLLQKMLRFGRWLNRKAEERDPSAKIESITLDTLAGRIEVSARVSGESFEFEIDEDLIERFLTTGSAESERSIFRILDVYLPEGQVARAS